MIRVPFSTVFKITAPTSLEVRVRTKIGGVTINPPGTLDGIQVAGINWADYIGHDLGIEVSKTKPTTYVIRRVY